MSGFFSFLFNNLLGIGRKNDNLIYKKTSEFNHIKIDIEEMDFAVPLIMCSINTFSAYECEIGYIQPYHPYWSYGEHNPQFDRKTDGKTLDLKRGDEDVIEYFFNEIYNLVCDVDGIENFYFCAVPSSNASKKHSPMQEICLRLSTKSGKKDYSSVLDRYVDIPKLATGGNRDLETHYNSIRIADGYNVRGKRFILLDDVTTTGGSMVACKNILEHAGAKEVACIAIAHTTRE